MSKMLLFLVFITDSYRTECNNFEKRLRSFDAARNDIWALGVIFACIIGGRMPWNSATDDDVNYARHMRHPHYLRQVLPISLEANFILQRIFNPSTEHAPSLDDIREMVLRAGTFFMTDKEIRRSKRLVYISDRFDEIRRFMEATEDSSESSDTHTAADSDVASRILQSGSLLALEEGRVRSRGGTPEAKTFIHGMVLDGGSPQLSLRTTSLPPAGVVRGSLPTPTQPPLTTFPRAMAPRNGTSSTMVTSKDDEQHLPKDIQHHRPWLKLSHSVRRLFGAAKMDRRVFSGHN